jgi:hypothetical protein
LGLATKRAAILHAPSSPLPWFSFNPDDRYKFSPDDQIMEICRALYPRWKFWQLGDSLEIATLMIIF